jgi:hypothetical protein
MEQKRHNSADHRGADPTDRIQQLVREVEGSTIDYQSPIDGLLTAYRINSNYMVTQYGIPDTARFLLKEKGKSLDEVVAYIIRGLKGADFSQHLSAPKLDVNIVHVEGDNNTVYAPSPQKPQQSAPEANRDVLDEDPHRFTLGDVLDLQGKLEAHKHFAELLAIQNDRMTANKVAKLTGRGVAIVGCIMRKNIRQNVKDPGAVPFDAITLFCKRNKDITANKAPADLAIGGAISILESVRFIKLVRKADRKMHQSAAYTLLDESSWQTPSHSPAYSK